MKKIILAIILLLSISLVAGVSVNENLTLRQTCTDAYNNPCTQLGYWTVINPNGTTTDNNTAGGNYALGVSNHTVWFNLSGVWFVRVNFSTQNISAEYNVVVEDVSLQDVQEEFGMSGVFVLFGLIIISLLYAAFNIGEKHQTLKWILVLFSILLCVNGGFMVFEYATTGGIGGSSDWIVTAFCAIILVLFAYLFMYVLYVALVNAGKIKYKGGGQK